MHYTEVPSPVPIGSNTTGVNENQKVLSQSGSQNGPPAYLKVQGFKDCLTDANTGKPHKEYCLPKTKPNSCNQSSWDQLQDVQECPIKCHVLANETISMEDLEGFDVKKINGKYCVEDVTQCKRIVGK